MTRRYDDDFDVRDDDFNERELRRRRRRRKVARAEALLAPPAIALMAVSVLSLVVLTVYCPYNIFVTMTEPRFQGDQAFNVGRYTGALFCVPLFMLSHLVVGISGFLMYTRKSYVMAMIGALLAIVPCFSPCYLLGIPFGLWAMVVLMLPDVHGTFRG